MILIDIHYYYLYLEYDKFLKFLFTYYWYFISFISFFFVCLANPGIINDIEYSEKKIKEKYQNLNRFIFCEKCNIYIPKHIKYEHCEYCKKCIIEQTHHSMIFGKCIGKYTFLIFIIFILSQVFIIGRFIYNLLLIIRGWFSST